MIKILLLLIFSQLSAETFFTDCTETAVFLASPCLSWGVDLNLLYLQASSNNLNYATEWENSKWKAHAIRPRYNLGYEFGISTFIQERSSKANLNYIHYRSQEGDKTQGFFINGGDLFDHSKGHVAYSLDTGHFDYGVLINCGNCLKTNFFGGVGLVRMKQKIKTDFTNIFFSQKTYASSLFIGIGPEIGFDFSYELLDGFQIVGKTAGTLFIGRLKNRSSTIHIHHQKTILPALEGKGGIAYTFKLGDCICSFVGGYQILFYWDAIQSIENATFQSYKHLSLTGPYCNFEVAF